MTTLLAKHAPDSLVAFGSGGERTVRDLLRDAAIVAEALPTPRPGSVILLCVTHDRYAFSVGMLAAIACGHGVALPPPDAERGVFLRLLQRPEIATVLHDTSSSAALRIDRLIAEPRSIVPLSAAALTGDVAFTFYPGPDGGHGSYMRRSSQLQHEASAIGRAAQLAPGSRVASSIAAAHPYGLVLGVLCPLQCDAALYRDTPRDGAELLAAIVRDHADVVVSVPAQLHGLLLAAEREPGRHTLRHVFSSRAPLPLASALRVRAQFGCSVFDLLGSHASGGVAYRSGEGARGFVPLPEVAVTRHADGRLLASAPWLAVPAPAALPERVLFRSGGDFQFEVGPSAALAALESELGCLPGVRDACLLRVTTGGAAATRADAADLQPSAADAQALPLAVNASRSNSVGAGARAITLVGEPAPRQPAVVAREPARCELLLAAVDADPGLEPVLRDTLRARFGAHALPDQFLFGPLARTGSGRHDTTRVLRAFGRKRDGTLLCNELEFGPAQRIESDAETRCVFEVHVPANYVYFEGHFPEHPILPGAAQLSDMVLPCVRSARPELGALTHMTRLKFSERISPDDTIEVHLHWRGTEPALEFALRRASTLCAAGRLSFSSEREA
jgi:hypothetical protein